LSLTGFPGVRRGTLVSSVHYAKLMDNSSSIGYVEFRTMELVDKAINLSGTVVMGLPIKVQPTEAERNRTHAGEGWGTTVVLICVANLSLPNSNLNLPPGVSAPHGPMQCVVSVMSANKMLTSTIGYTLVLCISILQRAISSRCSSLSVSSSSSTFTAIQRQVGARVIVSSSVYTVSAHIRSPLTKRVYQVQTRRRCQNGFGTDGRLRASRSHST
jgi:hypothetical protein